MTGEKNLITLLKNLKPEHKAGDYVFCVVDNIEVLKDVTPVLQFREKEGNTVVLQKNQQTF